MRAHCNRELGYEPEDSKQIDKPTDSHGCCDGEQLGRRKALKASHATSVPHPAPIEVINVSPAFSKLRQEKTKWKRKKYFADSANAITLDQKEAIRRGLLGPWKSRDQPSLDGKEHHPEASFGVREDSQFAFAKVLCVYGTRSDFKLGIGQGDILKEVVADEDEDMMGSDECPEEQKY
ncbi:hypothetical protein FRC17_005524 [Serendipita sp. 399]|nr:hypothetical protein FRC17_005524 [Serendipita sp. 399]